MIDLVLANAKKPLGSVGVYGARVLAQMHKEYYERVFEELWPVAGKRVLEIGCGYAMYAEVLVACGAEYIGIDHSADVIAECRVEFPEGTFFCRDAMDGLPFCDMAFMVNVLQWMDEPLAALRAAQRVVVPGGKIVVGAPDGDCSRRSKIDGLGLCSANDLALMLDEAGFSFVTVDDFEAKKTRYLIGVGVA